MLEGSAKEFLWQWTKDPTKHSEAFVRGIVHAALSDANGYVEGLTREYIDAQIQRLREYWGKQSLWSPEKASPAPTSDIGNQIFAKMEALSDAVKRVIGTERSL